MTSWRWDTSSIPEQLRTADAVMAFCPHCFAAVPRILLAEHRRAAHPETITEVP